MQVCADSKSSSLEIASIPGKLRLLKSDISFNALNEPNDVGNKIVTWRSSGRVSFWGTRAMIFERSGVVETLAMWQFLVNIHVTIQHGTRIGMLTIPASLAGLFDEYPPS